MDIVTHGLLGALAAQAISRDKIRVASIVGAIAALLPDLDVLIRSADDTLITLTYHRHFTHSLLFVPLGALLASLLLWPFLRRTLTTSQLYTYAVAGYLSACLLDVCTSYGTHLFWPFISEPVSLNIIAVVDPVFSLIVLSAGIAAVYTRKSYWSRVGLSLAGFYLLFGALQYHRAYDAAAALAEQRHATPERIIIKPTLGNVLLWRSIAVEKGTVQADAIRVGLPNNVNIYPGTQAHLIDLTEYEDLPPDSRAYRDLHRFYQLADHMLVQHPERSNFIGDVRYSMLPNSIYPMWGIVIDREDPDAITAFVVERDTSPSVRAALVRMLKGE